MNAAMQAVTRGDNRRVPFSPWDEVYKKLVTFLELEDGWDGMMAKALPRDVFTGALRLVLIMSFKGVEVPFVVLGGEGEVEFSWDVEATGEYVDANVTGLSSARWMRKLKEQSSHWVLTDFSESGWNEMPFQPPRVK